ncbi:sulfotransferase domain-containing protein [Pelagibacteraceae bacterium]|nr:sulfotransferase domain-containing protein [Pelagibacteraceae bacterium]
MSKKIHPDFIIVGFPKCGTTFIQKFLNEHKKIFMPDFEPVYFGTDFTAHSTFQKKKNYEKIFSNYHNFLTGEKSSIYASSNDALEKIYEHNKNTKIIVAIRNPIFAVNSYHNHNVRMGYETITELKNALKAQNRRASTNYKIPFYGRNSKERYQYFKNFNYPDKIKKIFKLFGKGNVNIIIFDDIVSKPESVMKDLFDFLNVEKIEQNYSIINESKPLLNHKKISIKIYYFLHFAYLTLKNNSSKSFFVQNKILNKFLTNIIKVIYYFRLFSNHPYEYQKYKPLKMLKNDINILRNHFNDEIDELSELIDRDLKHWKNELC